MHHRFHTKFPSRHQDEQGLSFPHSVSVRAVTLVGVRVRAGPSSQLIELLQAEIGDTGDAEPWNRQ